MSIHFCVFDVETQRTAEDVGGWDRADLMGISCVVFYDSKEDKFLEFMEDEVDKLIEHLKKCDLVIGFNNKRFDNKVISGYTDFEFGDLPTLDILEYVQKKLGHRLSLDVLSKGTLKTEKSANGLLALKWWKEGKIKEIVEYCIQDVELTKNLYLFGKENGYLTFTNRRGNVQRIPVEW